MICSYDEKLPLDIARNLLGDKFEDGLAYYMYSDMYECAVRAVNPVTKEEVWTESIRIDTEDTVVPFVRPEHQVRYGGHWFGSYKINTIKLALPWMLLAVICMASLMLIVYLKGGV